MSIPVSEVRAMSLLKISCETSRAFEFTFSLEPVFKLIPRKATTLQINFVSASPDLVVI
jgi:hypothetical protein